MSSSILVVYRESLELHQPYTDHLVSNSGRPEVKGGERTEREGRRQRRQKGRKEQEIERQRGEEEAQEERRRRRIQEERIRRRKERGDEGGEKKRNKKKLDTSEECVTRVHLKPSEIFKTSSTYPINSDS